MALDIELISYYFRSVWSSFSVKYHNIRGSFFLSPGCCFVVDGSDRATRFSMRSVRRCFGFVHGNGMSRVHSSSGKILLLVCYLWCKTRDIGQVRRSEL